MLGDIGYHRDNNEMPFRVKQFLKLDRYSCKHGGGRRGTEHEEEARPVEPPGKSHRQEGLRGEL